MRNKNLRDLIASKGSLSEGSAGDKVIFLNPGDLVMTVGGTTCPNLSKCSTFSDCNVKCVVNA